MFIFLHHANPVVLYDLSFLVCPLEVSSSNTASMWAITSCCDSSEHTADPKIYSDMSFNILKLFYYNTKLY